MRTRWPDDPRMPDAFVRNLELAVFRDRPSLWRRLVAWVRGGIQRYLKFYPFLVDANLGDMGAESFRTYHILARIIDGDAILLSPEDAAIAAKISERTAFPDEPIKELYMAPGRRAGKTLFCSRLAVYFAVQDYRAKLAAGELATVVCLACDREQAGILFGYCKALCLEKPLIRAELECDPTADTITFRHRSQIKIAASNFRGTRGSTYAAALLDEVAFFRSEDSAVPDVEIIRALKPGLMTLGGALICLSSPYMRKGVLFNAHKKHFGNNASKALYVQGESIVFNPTLNREAIAEAHEDDPEAAASEWGGLFRADLSNAFAGEWIDAAVCDGVFERPRAPVLAEGARPQYVAFTDPAGGSGKDSWATAICHAEKLDGGMIIQDALLEIRPPFSTTEAAEQTATFLKSYGITSVRGDAYAGMWPRDALALHGIGYGQSELPKSDIYRENVPLFSSQRIKILDKPRQTTQLRNLERRTRAGGKDSFDHPGGGNDDCSNALCGALLMASRDARPGDSNEVFVVRSSVSDGMRDNFPEMARADDLRSAGGGFDW